MAVAANQNRDEYGLRIHFEWLNVVLRTVVPVATYPLEYGKVLIQIGHEPIPPFPTRTFLGKPALGLPNIFTYMGYVRRRDGFFGLYRGLTSRILGNFIGGYAHAQIIERVRFEWERPLRRCAPPNAPVIGAGDNGDEYDEFEGKPMQVKVTRFMLMTSRNSLAKVVLIVVSQPFQVITVRTIAQFVGKERFYNGLLSSCREIYEQDGIFGFFSGIMPRLWGELLCLWIAGSLTFVINNYVLDDKDLKGYTASFMSFIANTVTYPYTLVSNCMIVSNSGLQAGSPPNMPHYINWKDCWTHLHINSYQKRGSSLLWRYYTGPYILKEGKPTVIGVSDFRSPYSRR